MNTDNLSNDEMAARWRLIMGRFADKSLPFSSDMRDRMSRMDLVLEYLYGNEYGKRGVRQGGQRTGTLGRDSISVPEWIREARELFPSEPMEMLTKHALQRYNMTELVTDPEVLEKLEPNYDLLKTILTFRGMMQGKVLDAARRIVRKVVDELSRKIMREVRPVLWGRASRLRHTRQPSARGLDFQRTIRANLKNYDAERRKIAIDRLYFYARNSRHIPYHIVMAVDCSGSMTDSVIHSSVMASIFHRLPSVKVSLVAFDTAIVDLTGKVDDPMDVLMSVQLGGGTDIGSALRYCESLVESPTRTIVVLITDFFEGGSPANVVRSVKRLKESGAIVLGLAALDASATPSYDRHLAQRCADVGAEIAALTPMGLATWLSKIIY